MRYISVCSGIEAASVAWAPLGWEAVAFSEIDPFPCAVLAQRFPGVPNLGDMTSADWRQFRGKIDLVVGGTPCQSFSIAGNRDGLDGASGIVREYIRLLRVVRPRVFVWENVVGALSSRRGDDFRFILGRWDDLGYSVAWRVLSAEGFGVPQARRRVYAVGYLGGWRYPASVLFEPDGVRGATACGRKDGQSVPEDDADGAREEGGIEEARRPVLVRMRQGKPGGWQRPASFRRQKPHARHGK